ncbi:MAG: RidA family protein [Chloroflexota bacterium]|nr:RidA family protein [Chloroflexota bacterium]
MTAKKVRIETDAAPASTGFRSQGLVAGGILFTAGQIGAAMPEPGVLREPSAEMGESVRLTLGHLDQVNRAAGLARANVFEVSAFPKTTGSQDDIQQEIAAFVGFAPELFNYHEVFDVAMHAQIEMDWMACADPALSRGQAAEWLRPLGSATTGNAIHSGAFVIWNGLRGHGADLGAASHALLIDLKARLEAEGGGFDDLVKLTIYLHAFEPYPLFNDATKHYFADIIPPTRSVLVAPDFTGDAKIMIDVVALKP